LNLALIVKKLQVKNTNTSALNAKDS